MRLLEFIVCNRCFHILIVLAFIFRTSPNSTRSCLLTKESTNRIIPKRNLPRMNQNQVRHYLNQTTAVQLYFHLRTRLKQL